ncbi:MAG: DUF2804 domain-containing protein [Clostridiales bacterium]|nr:DUF2804 domain-containing protein [Clostridiales bacterium]
MNQQKQFISSVPVLNEKGEPNPGWANAGILTYDRKAIKAPFYRIKEWDWYQINNDHLALQFTYGHASYAGQVGVMLFDFIKGQPIFTKDLILPLPFSSMHLAENAEKDHLLRYEKKGVTLIIETKNHIRSIFYRFEDFSAEITMKPLHPYSLVINIPFDEKPKAFYYNQKINCMQAQGKVVYQKKEYLFDHQAWGLLDWGRGVWPFSNQWYWSNASGLVDNQLFGFNLGCGFGNTSTATENALFYDNAIHKLGTVRFSLGETYTDPWHLTDDQGRLDLTLTPTYDRETKIKLLWVDNNTHQMFGHFNGTVTLDNGQVLEVKNLVGFAEHAINNW